MDEYLTNRVMMTRLCEKIIECGLMLLLIYLPLAYGGVLETSTMLFEVITGVLMLVWLFKLVIQRRAASSPFTATYLLPLGLFCVFILFQSIPLPDWCVNLLSPRTFQLYADAYTHIEQPCPKMIPLSACTQATETELYKWLAYIAVFVLIIKNVTTLKQVMRLIYCTLAVGLIETMYGLSPYLFSYKHQTLFNVSGTFINKNHFAGYLEMVILLTFGVLVTRFVPARLDLSHPIAVPREEKYIKAGLVMFLLCPMIAAHLLSGSRGGMMSLIGGLLIFWLLVGARRQIKRWLIVMLIFSILVGGISVFIGREALMRRVATFAEIETQPSFQTRWEFWRSAVHIFADFPLTGSGSGTFQHLSRRYQTFRDTHRHVRYTENDYVQLLAETGILGSGFVLLTVLLFWLQTFSAWKQRRSRQTIILGAACLSALFALVLHSLTDFNLHIPSNALLFTVIAALSSVATHTSKKHRAKPEHLNASQPISSPARQLALAFILGVGVLFYLFNVTRSYYAFGLYAQFKAFQARQDVGSPAEKLASLYLDNLQNAFRYDQNNPQYPYKLGEYLYRSYSQTQQGDDSEAAQQGVQDAENWLKQAIALDPANPWYYYELGRFGASRSECTHTSADFKDEDCAAARYLTAALRNAPKNTFLRTSVGAWMSHYDQDRAYSLMREVMEEDVRIPSASPRLAKMHRNFSRFLYDIRMDYESDRELALVTAPPSHSNARCTPAILFQSSDGRQLELGNDDNFPDWRVRVRSTDERIKKVFCLPDNLVDYNAAALKILMKSEGPGYAAAQINLDRHPLQTSDKVISVLRWYEFPLDLSFLQGKTQAACYLRLAFISAQGVELHILGDQDTPTSTSMFNYQETEDLSADEGVQTGEYLMRLVLKKH